MSATEQEIRLIVKDKLSGEEFEVNIPVDQTVGQLTRAVREELGRPEVDDGGPVTYRLVKTDDGLLLDPSQTVKQAGLSDGDTLSFWGEPTAAASDAMLRVEYSRILQRFNQQPAVQIEPILVPPREYRVTFRLSAPVGLTAGGEVKLGRDHLLHLRIGEDFPRRKPECVMLSPTWHPNIAHNGAVCIGEDYYLAQSVADVIAKVGNMLQWREYDSRSPYRRDVVDWLRERGGVMGPFDTVGFGEAAPTRPATSRT